MCKKSYYQTLEEILRPKVSHSFRNLNQHRELTAKTYADRLIELTSDEKVGSHEIKWLSKLILNYFYTERSINTPYLSEFIKYLVENYPKFPTYLLGQVIRDMIFPRGAMREEKDSHEKENGHWEYIPFNPESFADLLIKFSKNKEHFIDIGHGLGDKIFLARFFGNFKTRSGIEYNSYTYELSKNLLHDYKIETEFIPHYTEGFYPQNISYDEILIKGDAFDHDFSKYDFIYMYVPIKDRNLMNKLHRKVLNEMPVGGLAIDVGMSIWKDFIVVEKIGKRRFQGKYYRYPW